MKKSTKILTLAIVALLVCAGGFLLYKKMAHKAVVADLHSNIIVASLPLPHSKITSPVIVTGTARGPWYFEASFPIEVVDSTGKVIGQGIGQAQGDWMTTDFVPFKGEITFDDAQISAGASKSGKIILKKDNPSGLPEHEDSIEIPITF